MIKWKSLYDLIWSAIWFYCFHVHKLINIKTNEPINVSTNLKNFIQDQPIPKSFEITKTPVIK